MGTWKRKCEDDDTAWEWEHFLWNLAYTFNKFNFYCRLTYVNNKGKENNIGCSDDFEVFLDTGVHELAANFTCEEDCFAVLLSF